MGLSDLDPGARKRRVLNAGRYVSAKGRLTSGVDVDDALTLAERTEI